LKTFLTELMRKAGNICIQDSRTLKTCDLSFKNRKDLVTVTDRKVENFITGCIRKKFPSHDILGEETGRSGFSSDYLWVIDPIDGTTSFVHDQPFYCISIGLQHHGRTICGAVYLPRLDELFYADKETGKAFLNNSPIRVSGTDKLVDSVMATGFACLRAGLSQNNLEYFNKIVPKLRDIRRCGSAAMDLCYVACGRFDGFWEMNLNLYDIAAGAFIVSCAGGRVCDFNGKNNFPEHGIVAGNRKIIEKLLENF